MVDLTLHYSNISVCSFPSLTRGTYEVSVQPPPPHVLGSHSSSHKGANAEKESDDPCNNVVRRPFCGRRKRAPVPKPLLFGL